MTTILSELPKIYSDSAKTIIQQHLRRNTSGKWLNLSKILNQTKRFIKLILKVLKKLCKN